MALFDALQVMLRDVTYKPGHRFVLSQSPDGRMFLTLGIPTVDATKPDAHKPGQPQIEQMMTVLLSIDSRTKPEAAWEIFRRHLIQLTLDFERHEAKEFLKYRGVCLSDPHPDGAIG